MTEYKIKLHFFNHIYLTYKINISLFGHKIGYYIPVPDSNIFTNVYSMEVAETNNSAKQRYIRFIEKYANINNYFQDIKKYKDNEKEQMKSFTNIKWNTEKN